MGCRVFTDGNGCMASILTRDEPGVYEVKGVAEQNIELTIENHEKSYMGFFLDQRLEPDGTYTLRFDRIVMD